MQQDLKSLHVKDTVAFHRAGLYAALFIGSVPLAAYTWEIGWWPITVLLWIVIAHLGHVNLFVLHEASHYLLHPNRLLNEAQGMLVGTVSLVPLASYRHVHGRHHVHLAEPQDVEFWPFTDPSTSRPFRTFSAVMELLFGYIWTPGVFLRGCIVTPPKTLGQKLRIAFDYTVCFAFWGTALVIIGYLGIWKWFLVGYLVPSLMTGSMQTVRKFIEHLGLYGDTPDTATRTINDKSWFGRFISFTILNADIHGPHHVHAKIPQTHLPAALDLLTEEGTLTSTSIFPNYYQAAKAMLREVANPRIGKHWLASEPMKSSSNAPTALAG